MMSYMQLGIIIFLVWCFLVLPTHQLQSSQTQVLLQLRRHLEYPPQLEIWRDSHGVDFCFSPPSPALNLTCQNNVLTGLTLIGDKTTKVGAFPLQGLTLSQNFSMETFVTTLARLTTLKVLKLVSLGLWGPLPDKIKRLTVLECLDLTDNFLYGSVPAKISAMSKLQILVLDNNFFNGSVPGGFGALKNLSVLTLTNNRLQGHLPDLSGISRLQVLNLSANGLGFELPDLPKSLIMAFLNNNSFSGQIPKQYSQLTHLQYLDVSSNMLRGTPPDTLFSLPNITYLNLGSNQFDLISVHLSCSLKLSFVDLSNNKLKGSLPACLNTDSDNRTVIYDGNCLSLVGSTRNQKNESYCSETQELESPKNKHTWVLIVVIGGCVMVTCLMVYCLVLLYTRCCSRGSSGQHLLKKSMVDDNSAIAFSSGVFTTSARYSSDVNKFDMGGLPPCRSFSLEELKDATNNFDKTTFIGEGSYGKLYKGRLQNGTEVAVRCLPSSKRYSIRNLRLRLDLLSKLRHPHLVCLLGHCIDSGGQEDPRFDRVFLIYEYVPNGNFQARVSGNSDPASWSERLSSLIGVAKAVHFLHTGIIPGFFSNRLKSNNILLNQHGVAKLSDYGLSVISGQINNVSGKEEGPRKSWHAKSLEDDGYSFGYIILESFMPSVSSRSETFMMNEMGKLSTEEWQKVVDPYVMATCCEESLSIVISLTKKCISFDGSCPSFEDILWNLQYAAQLQATADAQ